jgi:hypothetical protein
MNIEHPIMNDEVKTSKFLVQYSLFDIPKNYFLNCYHCNNNFNFL